jgi:hypothetical protein
MRSLGTLRRPAWPNCPRLRPPSPQPITAVVDICSECRCPADQFVPDAISLGKIVYTFLTGSYKGDILPMASELPNLFDLRRSANLGSAMMSSRSVLGLAAYALALVGDSTRAEAGILSRLQRGNWNAASVTTASYTYQTTAHVQQASLPSGTQPETPVRVAQNPATSGLVPVPYDPTRPVAPRELSNLERDANIIDLLNDKGKPILRQPVAPSKSTPGS